MSHFLHTRRSNHDRHWYIEPQYGCGHVYLGYIDENTRPEPIFIQQYKIMIKKKKITIFIKRETIQCEMILMTKKKAYKILENAVRFSWRVHWSSAPDA